MRVAVIGTGFVGLAHSAVTASFGRIVRAYDIDKTKIEAYKTGQDEKINFYVNERGLPELIREGMAKGLLSFTSNLEEALLNAEAVFMCVSTPSDNNEDADLRFLKEAVINCSTVLAKRENKQRVAIVDKSTVPPGTADEVLKWIRDCKCENVGVVSNPEFLPEGEAVEKSIRPDTGIVVGAYEKTDFEILRRVYSQFWNHGTIKYFETNPRTAEGAKYARNNLLYTKIQSAAEIVARLGESDSEIDVDMLRTITAADQRIGNWGLYLTNGAGGSCFGKDSRAFRRYLKKKSIGTKFLDIVNEINEFQKEYLIVKAVKEAKFDFNNKTIAVLGLAFKQKTNDMREASSIAGINKILSYGANSIRAYDPLANEQAKKEFDPSKNRLYSAISYHKSMREAIEGSQALCIFNDSPEFGGASSFLEELVKLPYLVIDGKRMLRGDFKKLVEKGYDYIAVGSPFLKGKIK